MIQKGVLICHPDTEDPDLAGRAHPGVGAQVLADNAHPCAVDRDLADRGARCTAGLVLDVQAWGRLPPPPPRRFGGRWGMPFGCLGCTLPVLLMAAGVIAVSLLIAGIII